MSYQSVEALKRKSHYYEQYLYDLASRGKAYQVMSVVHINAELWRMYEFHLDILRELEMAKKKSVSNNATWRGYANVEINSEHEAAVEDYCRDPQKVWKDLVNEMLAGYKVSVDYVSKDDVFKATLTCNDTESPNSGLSLTAWAETTLDAIGCVLFKHIQIAGRKWELKEAKSNRKFG